MPFLVIVALALLAPGAFAQLPFRLAQPEPRPSVQTIILSDHDVAPPPIIIVGGGTEACSGRISGPGGSFLTLPAVDVDLYAGLPGTNEGSIILLDACIATLFEIGFENRSPFSEGFFSVGPLLVHARIEVLGNTFDVDLLPNGTIAMSGVPAFDGNADLAGDSGTQFLTSIRATFLQAAFQPAPGFDTSQPFPVRTTLTVAPQVQLAASAPITFVLDGFARGGISFSVLAP